MDSEPVTEASYTEAPVAESYASSQVDVTPPDPGAKLTAEAEGLLKAHIQQLDSALRDITSMFDSNLFQSQRDYPPSPLFSPPPLRLHHLTKTLNGLLLDNINKLLLWR